MVSKLKKIIYQVTSNQSALLKFRNEEGQQNLHVKIGLSHSAELHCLITGELPQRFKMSGKKVQLSQKYHNNYFFILGNISEEVNNNSRLLSISINKASWFRKKSDGNKTWMSEKYTYQNENSNV